MTRILAGYKPKALRKRYGRGPGRPAMAEGTAHTSVFSLKHNAEERETIDAAAERAGKPLSRWAREILLAAAADESER